MPRSPEVGPEACGCSCNCPVQKAGFPPGSEEYLVLSLSPSDLPHRHWNEFKIHRRVGEMAQLVKAFAL